MPSLVNETILKKKLNKTHVVYMLISALLIILLVFFVTYIKKAEQTDVRNNLNYKHLDYTDRLIIQILNIQTGARGYLLTKDEEFLNPFLDGISNLESILSSIERVWPDYLNQDQINSLEKNIDTVVENISLLIQSKTVSKTKRVEIYDSNKSDMDDLRENIIEIRTLIQKSIKDNQLEHRSFLNAMKWAILLLSIIAFTLLIVSFYQNLKQQKLIKNHALQIEDDNKNLEIKINNRTSELVDLASYMTAINENEKKRIARELHDELGSLLTAARMDTTWINRTLNLENDDPIKKRLIRMLKTIDKGIQVKRDITDSLVPPLLRELGLVEAIVTMTEDVPEMNPPKYDLQLSSTLPEIDSDRELALYRICQESLNNIRKYANASNVVVKLKKDEDHMLLEVIDDGNGFDLDDLKTGTHGISGMRARASMFKGTFEVMSDEFNGTHVIARIPLLIT